MEVIEVLISRPRAVLVISARHCMQDADRQFCSYRQTRSSGLDHRSYLHIRDGDAADEIAVWF